MTKDNDANAPDAPDEPAETLDLAAARARVADAAEISWIWDLARLAIVAANGPALEFWGVADAAGAAALHFPADDAMARALATADLGGAAARGDATQFSVLREADAVELTARLAPVVLDGGGRAVLVRVVGQGAARRAAAWLGDRAALVAETAAAAMTVSDADGALIWRNAAARRLFGDPHDGGSDQAAGAARFDELFEAPALGAALRRAALVSGAARRVARLRPRPGAPEDGPDADRPDAERRRDVVVARLAGLETGEWDLLATFLGPVAARATPDPGASPPDPAVAADRADAAARAAALGIGRLVFDAAKLRLIAADAGAWAILARRGESVGGEAAPEPTGDATLWSLFPHDGSTLEAAIAAARAGGAARLTLSLDGARPGPWLRAALSIADQTAVLDILDLAAERRSLLRLALDAEERAGALEALGVGVLRLDADGRVREADEAAAETLGRAIDQIRGAPAAELLDAATGRRLARYLRDGPVQEGRLLERGVFGSARATGAPLRVAVAPPTRAQRGRRAVAVAPAGLDAGGLGSSGASPAAPAPSAPPAGLDWVGGARARAIRTELTTARGFAELLRDDPQTAASPLSSAYLDDIVEAVDRITALVSDDADAARVRAAGDALAEPSQPMGGAAAADDAPSAASTSAPAMDLARLVRDVADTLAIGARPDDAAVVMVAEVDPSAPTVIRPRDRAALRELVENLIGLAPPADRGRLVVRVASEIGEPSESPAPDAAATATLTVAGAAGLGAGDPRRRVIELLADRLGAAADIAASGEIALVFPRA